MEPCKVQVEQSCPYPAVVWNILVDHGRVESLALASDEAAGRSLLRHPSLSRWHISAIWCIGSHNDGPVEMTKHGASESIWPWPQGRRPPGSLLSSVRLDSPDQTILCFVGFALVVAKHL
jgi:hypothetical protein